MPSFLPDTSCLVAAVCAWHTEHERARQELERRLDEGERLIVAGHSLVETYSVLTRLPVPHRIEPASALDLIAENYMKAATIVALDPAAYRALLATAPANGVQGGRVYDAVIAECAMQAGADTLLTFNARHFEPPVTRGVRIVVPAHPPE